MKTTKKQYSAEEKSKIALESMQYGFASKASKEENDLHELIDKLYRQIGQLSIECDWLKKKSELFKS